MNNVYRAHYTTKCYQHNGLFVLAIVAAVLCTILCVGYLVLRKFGYRFSFARCWVCIMESYYSFSCSECIGMFRDALFTRQPAPFSRKRLSRAHPARRR